MSIVLTTPALDATVSSTGDKILFHDYKGYESDWRKHHTSAVTRDIWVYDTKAKKYTQLSSFNGEDRNPVFDANDNDFYYLSEQSGSFNVYKSSVRNPAQSVAVTRFTKNPVRFLTRAKNGTLAFSYDGELYTMTPGGQPKKVAVRIGADGRNAIEKILPVSGGMTEAKLAPNGKEFAFVFRGEIFVSSIDGKLVKRITNTPWQERSVSFSPDGRTLVYAAEKDNNWNVYTMSLTRTSEPYLFASTVLKDEAVVATPAEEFQPTFSPDGKEIAYLENRQTLKVYNLASKQSRTVLPADLNYSYADGDQYYSWSPDSKWLLVQFAPGERMFAPEVGIVAADGTSPVRNLTQSGYDDATPKWAVDGKMMIWGTTRDGALSQGGGAVSGDVYGMYFTKAAYDRAKLSKEEFALVKEREDKDKKKDEEKEGSPRTSPRPAKPASPIAIDWDGLTDRKMRLTINTSAASDWVLSKDGEKLFYLTSFEKGNDLWVTEVRTRETKLFNKLGANAASMELSPDGKFLFVIGDGKAVKVDTESGKSEPIAGQHGNGPGLLGREGVHLRPQLASVQTEAGLPRPPEGRLGLLLHDLQEVPAPHQQQLRLRRDAERDARRDERLAHGLPTTARTSPTPTRPPRSACSTTTATPARRESGRGAPGRSGGSGRLDDQDRPRHRSHRRQRIDAAMDFYKLLNRKAGKFTLLAVYDPASNKRWEETVKPVDGGEEGELLYKRWVRRRRADVEKLSGGKIGYVHVRSNNDASMRVVFEEALGLNLKKDAIVVDTRFNGGGNIHEQLSDFLSGKKYFDVVPHGQYIGSQPFDKWIKPSIVVMGESNYSDAHLFPLAYKAKNLGLLVGMPVPGTGTFVWWENQIDPTLRFGIPMGCWRTLDGKCGENNQTEPDIRVANEPES